jgi:hypothetical protein
MQQDEYQVERFEQTRDGVLIISHGRQVHRYDAACSGESWTMHLFLAQELAKTLKFQPATMMMVERTNIPKWKYQCTTMFGLS